jgi:hypothetical protein
MSATATQRRATQPVVAALPRPNPREFPVRFTPNPGLRSLLRRPPNTRGWVGAGAILIDQQSLRITAKRLTPLGLRRTLDFVHQSEIREVYREGNAIRVDLLDEERPGYFCLWAEDAESAAEIVRRLPTSSTVEIEGVDRAVWEEPPQRLSRSVLWAAACLVLIGGSIWAGKTLFPPVRAPQTIPHQGATLSGPLPMPIHTTSAVAVVPDVGTLSDLEKFTARFDALASQFSVAFDALQTGELSQAEFADGLEHWLIPQWRTVSTELAAPAAGASVLRTNTDVMLKQVSDSWSQALTLYAQGLRDHDYREVLRGFDFIRDAEEYENESHGLLAQLEAHR